jgi:HD superfamily phosphohydrolase
MNVKRKTIRDPIHGDIKFEGVFLDLIEAPEIQRLYNIKQLGFAHLVFPGAHHTRLEHCLGSYYLAFKAGEALNLKKDERILVSCAALLHDIGHGPFSHTLETILRDSLNVDHVDLTEKLILGKHAISDNYEKEFIGPLTVFDILVKYDINPKDVVKIIRGNTKSKQYLGQLLVSTIDVDQLDYIIRDSYYTGVAYGLIDIERFLQTLVLKNNKLAVKKKGVGVVENILMARTLMYSSVYFHKTVRIAELMLSKAIELMKNADPFDFFKFTDDELINDLKKKGDFQKEIAIRLKYRRLFKQAYVLSKAKVDKDEFKLIKKLDDIHVRRKKEEEFEKLLKIPKGHVIIDVPYTELHQSEPRIDSTDIGILDGDKIKKLDEYTPVGSAVKSKNIPDWLVMIITDEKYRDIVSNKAKKILFK